MMRFNQWLVHVVGGLLIVATYYALRHWSFAGISRWWLLGAAALSLAFTLVLRNPEGLIHRGSTRTFLLISGSLIALVRLAWVLAVPTLPVSDFEQYHSNASAIAQGVFQSLPYQEAGHSLLLGALYHVFGVHLLVAKVFNVLLAVSTGWLLFWIASQCYGEATARVVVALFVLWPSQVMLSSVLASEFPYTVALFGGILALTQALRVTCISLPGLLSAGILLGLSNTIRPTSVVVLTVGVIGTLALSHDRFRRRVGGAAILIGGFSLIMVLYLCARWQLFGISPLSSALPINLLVGTNIQATGMWNPEDGQLFTQLLQEHGPVAAGRIVERIAVERVRANPWGFAALLLKKFEVMWGGDLHGAYWSTLRMRTGPVARFLEAHLAGLYTISQCFYVWVLVLGIAGCVRLRKRAIHLGISLLLVIFLAFVLLHSVIVVDSRYHYPWAPIFLILGAYGLLASHPQLRQASR